MALCQLTYQKVIFPQRLYLYSHGSTFTHMAVRLQSDFSSYCLVDCQSQWTLVQQHRSTVDPNPCPICFYSSDGLPYMTKTKQCTRLTTLMHNPKKFQMKRTSVHAYSHTYNVIHPSLRTYIHSYTDVDTHVRN